MNLFHKVPVDIPNKSGFDMSHSNYFTARCGTLTPALVEPLLPNDTVSLDIFAQIQMPPMATDFYGDVDAKFEVFFVPYRLLYGGWQEVITRSTSNRTSTDDASVFKLQYLPTLQLPQGAFDAGELADYLGLKCEPRGESDADRVVPNPLPFLAYHKIYDDWYRESRVQKPVFTKLTNNLGTGTTLTGRVSVANLPYLNVSSVGTPLTPLVIHSENDLLLNDGENIAALRQRNWSKDYFTNATPRPQSGSESSLQFAVDTDNKTASFTISALRAANSLQRYMERNNIAGFRYADQIKATYGIYPSDAVLDRCIYLGGTTIPVITKSVLQTAGTTSQLNDQNPFYSIGTKYGNPQAFDQGSLVGKFTAEEHGFLFVMFSLVPKAKYSSGTRRYLAEQSQADIPNPLLQGVGDQPIYDYELTGQPFRNDGTQQVFGYCQRYAHYKFHGDEVHGLLRDGFSLENFSLQRSFSSSEEPVLGNSFLEIPTYYMDQVTAVNGDMSRYGCWVQCGFKFHKSSTLSAYDIPTLGDLKNVHTEVIDNGGRRL